jgi:uncharacterized protein YjbJ (UPF0337 family)
MASSDETRSLEDPMIDRNEKLRGYANEFIGAAKQLFGEIVGSQKKFDEGKHQRARGETQVEWGEAKANAEDEPKDPLKDVR